MNDWLKLNTNKMIFFFMSLPIFTKFYINVKNSLKQVRFSYSVFQEKICDSFKIRRNLRSRSFLEVAVCAFTKKQSFNLSINMTECFFLAQCLTEDLLIFLTL